MSANNNKRKKSLTPEDKKKAGLKGLTKVIFQQLNIHTSLQAWGQTLENDSAAAIGLFTSVYRGDGIGMNTHVLHPSLIGYVDVKRDEKGAIVRLKDNNKARVVDKSLEKLQVCTYATLHGFRDIIFEAYDDVDTAADVLFMPTTVQFSELSSSQKKPHHSVALELYSYGNKINVFTPPAKIKELTTLSYLDSTNVKGVLMALNSLLEKEAFSLDLASLDDLGSLQTLLKNAEKQSQARFFQTLIAAKVDGSKNEDKVKAFIANPDSDFARLLGFKKPYVQPLFEQGTNAKVERIPLSSLGDDDDVLLSTVTIDTKFYESIRSDIGSLLVYKKTANLGIKKSKKWAQLQTTGSMKASLFTRLMESIAESNKGTKTNATAKASKMDEEDSDDEAENLTL